MGERQAIRGEGDRAEQEFLRLVPESRASADAKLGDVVVQIGGQPYHVEVKQCQSKGGTINQVRALKYITCVIWAPERNPCWYVLSPDQLVQLAATKQRGQHNEIPFECMNFTLNSLPAHLHTRATDEELLTAVCHAVGRGIEAADLLNAMQRLRADIDGLRQQYLTEVGRIIANRERD